MKSKSKVEERLKISKKIYWMEFEQVKLISMIFLTKMQVTAQQIAIMPTYYILMRSNKHLMFQQRMLKWIRIVKLMSLRMKRKYLRNHKKSK